MSTSSKRETPHRPSDKDILGVLDGEVRTSRFSVFYLAGLFIVAIAMIMLPMIYIGLIMGIGYALYYHATHSVDIFGSGLDGGYLRLLLYIAPLVAGSVWIAFMIKPLFSRNRRDATGMVIDSNNEPLLPAYIEKLCRSMGAPIPREIKVDCTVNATAALKYGIFGRSLTLTIGLPLVTHLSLRELTSVLAHEFGHFSQRIGMRISSVITSINAWFYRVVYRDDTWDDKLREMSESSDGYVVVIVLIVRFMVWLTRWILWALMMIGHMISCFMSRQMEYAADRCAGLVAGSDAAAAALSKLLRLSIAEQLTYAQLREFWRERQLVDNLPVLVTSKVNQVPQKVLDEIEQNGKDEETKLFSTHPLTPERIRRVKKLDTKGIVRRDGPARLLFRNFDAIAKAATLVHYREMISRNISTENLISAKRLQQEEEKADRESRAIGEYFGHEIYVCRPILFDDPHIQPTNKPKATIKKLKEAHQRISKAVFKIAQVYCRYDDAENGLIAADQASALIRANVKIDHKDFSLQAATLEAVDDARRRYEATKRKEGDVLLTYEKVLRLRLNYALQLLSVPEIGERIKNADGLLREAQRIVSVLARLRDFFGRFNQLQADFSTSDALLLAAGRDPENAALFESVDSRVEGMIECVRDARSDLRDVTYPFIHGSGKISVAEYAIEYMPGRADLAEALHAVDTFTENMMALYVRSIGRLAYIARQVEHMLGLPSMPVEEDSAISPSQRG